MAYAPPDVAPVRSAPTALARGVGAKRDPEGGATRRTGLGALLLVTTLLAAGLAVRLAYAPHRPPTVFGHSLTPGDIEGLLLAVAVLGGASLLTRTRPRRVTARMLVTWRRASLARRLGMVAAAVFVAFQLEAWLAVSRQVVGARLRSATTPTPLLIWGAASAHVPHLVRRVVTADDPGPTVVAIDDHDPRADQAAFYCYPRLLVMAPEQRRWATLSRMEHLGGHDPGFPPPGDAPSLQATLEAARLRGSPAVLAHRHGTRELAEVTTDPRAVPGR